MSMNVAMAVLGIQNALGHTCGGVIPPAGGLEDLDHLERLQRQAFEAWLRNESRHELWRYGIVSWGVYRGTTSHITSGHRLEVLADENEGTVQLNCWAGPSDIRPAGIAASVKYELTWPIYRSYVSGAGDWFIVDSSVDEELLEEKPYRASYIAEIDLKVFGGVYRQHTTHPILLNLFKAEQHRIERDDAYQETWWGLAKVSGTMPSNDEIQMAWAAKFG